MAIRTNDFTNCFLLLLYYLHFFIILLSPFLTAITHPMFFSGLGLLRCFLLWMVAKLSSGTNFEILQAYLHRLLAVYAELILKQPDALSIELERVREVHAASSNRFRFLVQSNICLLKMFAGLPPT